MAHLFHHTRLSPVLILFGVGGILCDDWQAGLTCIGIAVAYWWVGERRARPSRELRTGFTVANPGAASDGIAGAFSRLDPSMQTWLRAERRARTDATE